MPNNLLFDFGAVLIPIDAKLSYKAFEALGAKVELEKQEELFHKVERGQLDSRAFLSALQPFFFRKNIFKKDLAAAWNALCYEPIPSENIALLKSLRKKGYKLYLLSNTNELHLQKIKANSGRFDYAQFLKQFDGIYFSHEVGHRKPEPAFYKQVLKKEKLKADDCFFIDDREENIEAAEKLGIKSWHFDPAKDKLSDILKKVK